MTGIGLGSCLDLSCGGASELFNCFASRRDSRAEVSGRTGALVAVHVTDPVIQTLLGHITSVGGG